MPGAAPLVLVVDDDESIREVVKMALDLEGYEVEVAEHGAAALDAIRARTPALILLDMKMPVMDGWEFARVYQQVPGPRAPIVVMTAARNGPDRALQAGAAGHLDKPFDIDELLACVRVHASGDGRHE